MTTKHTFPKKFLPLEQFHVVEVSMLDPVKLKMYAKRASVDREEIKHTTILNAIAKAIGVKGGFAAYKAEYEGEIVPFLQKNGLVKQGDLFSTPRNLYYWKPFLDLTGQAVSERIFLSGLSLPRKIFTGYNFSSYDEIFDGTEIFESWEHHKTKLLCTCNLIGDSLVHPAQEEPVVEVYFTQDCSAAEAESEKTRYRETHNLFRRQIEQSEMGWVEIIPYNDNLVFLKGQNGVFDFVFRNQRNNPFLHVYMDSSLKVSDLPYWIDDYHFDRWYYFNHRKWKDLQNHESENYFYQRGGTAASYPGTAEIRKSYYSKFEGYTSKDQHKAGKVPQSYMKISLLGNDLAISQLVTIKEFREYLSSSGHFSKVKMDRFNADNANLLSSLPVTVSFFDILSYTKWLEKEKGISARLLTNDEYADLRKREHVPANEEYNSSDIIFSDKSGTPFGNNLGFTYHPPRMTEYDFDSLPCQFAPSVKQMVSKSGFGFVDSNFFAEWLQEKTCIRSGNLRSFYGSENVIRETPPLDCTGRYKHLKIGFRVCVDLNS